MARIIFMGTSGFAVPALSGLVEAGLQVVAVYTQPDRPAGRGRRLLPSPVKQWAERQGLPLLQPASVRSAGAVEELRALRPDVIVVAAYGKLLPQVLLDIPPRGVVNIHPSLLPRYRGASPIVAAILGGDEVTGVTVMLVDAGLDSGPTLAQRREPISATDTAESLGHRLARRGGELLVETLPSWLSGELEPKPQDDSEATYCQRIRKEDGKIDWSCGAEELWRRLRAFQPWPGFFTFWRGGVLKLLEGSPLERPAAPPGMVVPVELENGPGIGITTGRGILVVQRLQPEGRRPMTAQEFLAGHGDFLGAQLPI